MVLGKLAGKRLLMPIFDIFSNALLSLILVVLCFIGLNTVFNSYTWTDTYQLTIAVKLLQDYLFLLILTTIGLFTVIWLADLITKNDNTHITARLHMASFGLISLAAGICITDGILLLMFFYGYWQLWAFGLLGAAMILYQTGKVFYSNFGRAVWYLGKRFYRKAKREMSSNKKIGSVAEAP